MREVVVVEGLHDRQAVLRAVDAEVWVLGGDRPARSTLAELKRAATTRGVVVLTDPDGPGERIRRRVADAVPGARHAFLTRAEAQGAHSIGVEHAQPAAIAAALQAARTPGGDLTAGDLADGRPGPGNQQAKAEDCGSRFTLSDLQAHGLAGEAGAATRRGLVGERLGIGSGNAQAFVRKLNVLGVTREEWEEATRPR